MRISTRNSSDNSDARINGRLYSLRPCPVFLDNPVCSGSCNDPLIISTDASLVARQALHLVVRVNKRP